MIAVPRIYIAAIKKTSGKTTLAIAINRILRDMGLSVQAYKKGPDFIDPMWHTQATGRASRNLDFFLMGKDMIKTHFAQTSQDADIAVIEGNHGLFDDINVEGGSDNASLAKLLKAPVVLVMDVKEMGRTVAALIKGCMEFDRELNIAGIILNRIQNKRQEKRLKEVIELYTKLPILGCIPEMEQIAILQRHLGLTSTLDKQQKEETIRKIAEHIKPHLHIKGIVDTAKKAKTLPVEQHSDNHQPKKLNLKVGLAYDEAFNFYYPENIEMFQKHGCEIVEFSPLRDEKPPKVDALYIGGGFPEIFADEIERNSVMREKIREFVCSGGHTYAECGGLIYLTEKLSYNGKHYSMVGAIEASAEFTKKPVGHGYTILKPTDSLKWIKDKKPIKGHEFHHAKLTSRKISCAFQMMRGFGVNGKCDGIIKENTIAGFTHQYAPSSTFLYEWLSFVSQEK